MDVHLNMHDMIDQIQQRAEALKRKLASESGYEHKNPELDEVLFLITQVAHVLRIHEDERSER